ncbi:Cellulose synthase (UDP-forming) [Xylanimonas cellulosilytica DSM 15894]|uniref:Cellulose synthase (UDP-forming) n=1 Tax=Xylanimonas cellulosilytica (strain DSM 15894 / JCM 12276 / CECT 5975 / KCTC 9989 / LMG 20990 / NBRC 107835 / XIL07) TaxID=446471 RepID=D1BUM8_XYLCX|nr:cellulose synthase catalytic subunit [Xylanimonas cellulosilytica]ACZ29269.1 Cellulose synthase (UDP-forming) [Xylanimonas cellulosilytica DSM 15894]
MALLDTLVLDPGAAERLGTGRPGIPRPDRPRADRDRPGADPQAGRRQRAAATSPSLMLLVLLATLGIVAYAGFLLNPHHRGDLLPWLLVVFAESVLVAQALAAMWTVLSSGYDPRDFRFHHAADRLFDVPRILADGDEDDPTRWTLHLNGEPIVVDILITTCGEDLAKIEATVAAAVAVRGAHRTWVLDDGRDDAVRELAARLGARYVRRLSGGGQKAGNVNHGLTVAKGDFYVILDADFVPEPELLTETIPFFVDRQVAFVQTPQTYGNMRSIISRGAGYMQELFYRFVQPGRNRFNAAFCVGTNVVFRRAAIDDVGGMYTDSKSEDVWTSINLHERGWKSVYIPTTLAVGDTPETIEAYSKQQLRWATGGFEILLQHNPLARGRRLTVDQRLQYLVTATHYLAGIVPAILLLIPPLFIYLDLTPMSTSMGAGQWAMHYLGFYALQMAIATFTLGSFRWEVLLLSAVSFPIYLKAFRNALTRRQQAWHVTGSRSGHRSPFEFIVPQMVTFVFLALTSVVGVLRQWDDPVLTAALAWNLVNTLILGGFLVTAAREDVTGRRAARQVNATAPPPRTRAAARRAGGAS